MLVSKREVPKETFAKRLKQLRELYNVSQADLARYLKLNRAQVSNYEKGISKPSLDVIENIADYFGVSIDYLLCRTFKNLKVIDNKSDKNVIKI